MRFLEAQARVIEAQSQREVELAKLAQKDGAEQAWLMAELQKSQLDNQVKKFQIGVNAQMDAKKLANQTAELQLAARTGSGI